MATGDIYFNRFNCSSNNRAWAFGLHCEETTPSSQEQNAEVVADAVAAHVESTLTAILSDDSFFESVQSWKVHGVDAIAGVSVRDAVAGGQIGDTMPSDNALVINLRQIAGAARFNGSIALAGQIMQNHQQNQWSSAYLTGAVDAFADVLLTNINAISPEGGVWRFVVLSKAFSPSGTPVGTALDIVSTAPNNRVMTQRRRKQKVRGWS